MSFSIYGVCSINILLDLLSMTTPMSRELGQLPELLIASPEIASIGEILRVLVEMVSQILLLSELFVAYQARKLLIWVVGDHVPPTTE